MSTNTSTVVIAAPAAVVWEWLTQPERVREWQYGSTLITDWQPGSEIRFRNEWDGQVFEQWGTVLTVDQPREIRYTLFFPGAGVEDRPENYLTMTYSLQDTGDGTQLSVSQEDTRETPDATDGGAADDGPNVLEVLKQLIESA
jgi:uncharacterized protein YndB with AHSA1/START domain